MFTLKQWSIKIFAFCTTCLYSSIHLCVYMYMFLMQWKLNSSCNKHFILIFSTCHCPSRFMEYLFLFSHFLHFVLSNLSSVDVGMSFIIRSVPLSVCAVLLHFYFPSTPVWHYYKIWVWCSSLWWYIMDKGNVCWEVAYNFLVSVGLWVAGWPDIVRGESKSSV